MAALTPNQPAAPAVPASPQMDPADIARLLQAHLKRVGCNPSNVDGKWDDGSRKALELFNKNAQTKFEVKLASLDALDAVRGKTDRVCPLVCDSRLRPQFKRCLREKGGACAEAEDRHTRGACVARGAVAPRRRWRWRRQRSASRSTAKLIANKAATAVQPPKPRDQNAWQAVRTILGLSQVAAPPALVKTYCDLPGLSTDLTLMTQDLPDTCRSMIIWWFG